MYIAGAVEVERGVGNIQEEVRISTYIQLGYIRISYAGITRIRFEGMKRKFRFSQLAQPAPLAVYISDIIACLRQEGNSRIIHIFCTGNLDVWLRLYYYLDYENIRL